MYIFTKQYGKDQIILMFNDRFHGCWIRKAGAMLQERAAISTEQLDFYDHCQWDFVELCYSLVQMNDLQRYRICDALSLINLFYEQSQTRKNALLYKGILLQSLNTD